MSCIIDGLLDIVIKDLELAADSPNAFSTKAYINDIYNYIYASTIEKYGDTPEGQAKALQNALSFSIATPAHMDIVLSNIPEYTDKLLDKGLSRDELAKIARELRKESGLEYLQKEILDQKTTPTEVVEILNTNAQEQSKEEEIVNTAIRPERRLRRNISKIQSALTADDVEVVDGFTLSEINNQLTPKKFTAYPATANTDDDMEFWPDWSIRKAREVYYKAKRLILDFVFGTEHTDSSLGDYPGIGPIRMSMRSSQRLPQDIKNELLEAAVPNKHDIATGTEAGLTIEQITEKVKKRKKDNIVFGVITVLIDKDGNDLHIDPNGKLSKKSEGNKLAYWDVLKVDDKTFDKTTNKLKGLVDTTTGLPSKYGKRVTGMIESLMRRGGITQTAATEIIKKELRLIYDITEYIKKTAGEKGSMTRPNEIITTITGGSYGYLEYDINNIHTALSELDFSDEDFKLITGEFDDKITGEMKGFTYFRMKNTGDTRIVIERPGVSENKNIMNKVISLLIDDIWMRKPGKSVPELLSNQQKATILEEYIMTRKGVLQIPKIEAEEDYVVLFKGKPLDLSTPEAKELARKKLTDYFQSEMELVYIKDADKLTDTQKKNIKKSFNEITEPGQVVEIKEKVKDDVTGKLVESGKLVYEVYDTPRLNLRRDSFDKNFTDVDLSTDKDGKIIAKANKDTYHDYVKKNFFINYSARDGKLVRRNAYLIYEPVPGELDKIYAPKVNPVEEIKKQPNAADTVTDNQIIVDPRLIAKRIAEENSDDYNPLEKNIMQKQLNRGVTKAQIIAAKKWYEEESGLHKYFPYEVMFDAINSERPNSIANWVLGAAEIYREGIKHTGEGKISLYKDADYTDLYHEAFHAVFQTFLTKTQKQELFTEVRKMSGFFRDYKGNQVTFSEAKPLQIEEWLAEDFREFMIKGTVPQVTTKKLSIFQKIWEFIKALFFGVTVDDVVSGEKSLAKIQELYQKIRVGNLSEYTFTDKNATATRRASGIERFTDTEPMTNLSYEMSRTIVDSIDSLFSDYIDYLNSMGILQGENSLANYDKFQDLEYKKFKGEELNDEEQSLYLELVTKKTYKFTSQVLSTKRGLREAYSFAERQLANLHNKLVKEITDIKLANPESADPVIQRTLQNLQSKVDALAWMARNFGDIKDLDNNRKGKGVIGYHQLKSQFLSKEDREAFYEGTLDEEDAAYLKGNDGHNKNGAERALKDLASREILYLMRSLHDKISETEHDYNSLGIKKLISFDKVWNRFVRVLQNSRTPQQMFNKLMAESTDYLPIKQLMSKMGAVNTTGTDEFGLWTNFWQTFNKSYIPLTQATLDITTIGKDKDGKPIDLESVDYKYSMNIGKASTEYRRVGMKWTAYFKTNNTNEFIKRDKLGNYLDVNAVLKKFPIEELTGKEFQFFRAIGFLLEDKKEVRDFIKENPGIAKQIHSSIEYVKKRGIIVREFKDFLTSYAPTTIEVGGKLETLSGKDDDEARYNRLQQLHARYSDDFSNFMVSNAADNYQFEHSLNNTLTLIANTINDVEDYASLIRLPYMSHLDISRNPFAEASTWLNSIFKLRDAHGEPIIGSQWGKKREQPNGEPVEIELTNLSGVLIQENGKKTGNGIESAQADEFTKLIMDFHITVLKGTPELMRHADKSTSYAFKVSHMFTPNNVTRAGNSSLYVDTLNFLEEDGQLYAYNIIKRHIGAELERINRIKDNYHMGEGDAGFDFGYLERGKDFVIFDSVLREPTKKALLKLKEPLMSYLNKIDDNEDVQKLNTMIYKDFEDYFNDQIEQVKELQAKTPFISDNVYTSLAKAAKKNTPEIYVPESMSEAKNYLDYAVFSSFVYNSWIHNLESIALLYGDLAQYAVEKDDFHKRNAGIGSTGNIYRTDQDAIDHVNKILGRGWQSNNTSIPIAKQFDGTFDTAVLKDVGAQSVYVQEYIEAEATRLRQKAKSKIDAADEKGKAEIEKDIIKKATKTMKAYGVDKNKLWEEGDGQGWITMDAYRILSSLEGKWTSIQEHLYQRMIKGEPISHDMVKEFFPAQKLQYWGPLKTKGLPMNAFHKFSLVPLIPSVLENAPKLKALHDKMMTEGIDYALFKSGSKISTITKAAGEQDLFYKDNATREFDDTTPYTKNTIFLEYLKDQLEIAPKFKGQVVFSTQMRKIIENSLVENGLPTDFMKDSDIKIRMHAWDALTTEEEKLGYTKGPNNYKIMRKYEHNISELTARKTRDLLDEINWKIGPDGKPSGKLDDLMLFVKNELSRQDLADHEIDFIQVRNGKLVNDLSLSLSADKIERLLNAIVVNRLVKQKVKGEALILTCGVGFETPSNFENPTDEDIKRYGTNGLATYHIDKDGKTHAMKVKVALQGDFQNLLHLDDVVELAQTEKIDPLQALNKLIKDEDWLDKEDNRKMITMCGERIPVQEYISLEFMEVYEFLPTIAGNMLIPPAEMVAKSGSDFDIDKLNVHMPHISLINGKPEYARSMKLDKVKESQTELKKQRNALHAQKKAIYEKYTPEQLELDEFKKYKTDIYNAQKTIAKLKPEWDKLFSRKVTGIYTPAEFEQVDAELTMAYATLELASKEFIKKVREKPELRTKDWKDIDIKIDREIDLVEVKIANIQRKLVGISTKGIENDLIESIVEILSLPENLARLVRPNTTDIVEPLARGDKDTGEKGLDEYVKEYNAKRRLFTEGVSKNKLDQVSGTRILEIGHNLFKHYSNNIGMQVLGMGAVGNTANSLFNRVGAYMNPTAYLTQEEYDELKKKSEKDLTKEQADKLLKFRRQKLFLPHNTYDVNGKTVISLSHTYDVDSNHSISDILSQMINGWVDIAKDPWIFYVQGNKEVEPVLEFMIKAGVPFKTAVYLVSQPLIRKYVTEQKIAKSIMAEALGKAPVRDNDFRYKAREEMLINPDYGFNMKVDESTDRIAAKTIYEKTISMLDKVLGKDMFDQDKLYDNITEYDKKDPIYNDYQRAALLHFIEIEEMGKATRDIKMAMNFDTNRSTTLFEAQNKTMLVNDLLSDGRFPRFIIDKLLGEKKEDGSLYPTSPISSFFIQPLQTVIWKDLFPLRNHPVLNSFLSYKVKHNNQDIMNTFFGNTEKFAAEFKNQFINFIFQNSFQVFDLYKTKNYKGTTISRESIIKAGAIMNKNTMFLSTRDLAFQWNLYENDREDFDNYYKKLDMAPIDGNTFSSSDEYFKFVMEREYLRGTLNYSNVVKSTEFKLYAQTSKEDRELIPQFDQETDAEYAERYRKDLYQYFLRDKALDNVYNPWKLFSSNLTYAEQFQNIREEFPELQEQYMMMDYLIASEASGYKNLQIVDPELTGDKKNILHENLQNLSNRSKIKVDGTKEDNDYVSEFFNRMSIVAFLQSGLTSKGPFSLIGFVPQDQILSVMKQVGEDYVGYFDYLSEHPDEANIMLAKYYQKFIDNNHKLNKVTRIRSQKYAVETKLRDVVDLTKITKKTGIKILRSGYTQLKTTVELAQRTMSVEKAVEILDVFTKPSKKITSQQANELDLMFGEGWADGSETFDQYLWIKNNKGLAEDLYSDLFDEDSNQIYSSIPELIENNFKLQGTFTYTKGQSKLGFYNDMYREFTDEEIRSDHPGLNYVSPGVFSYDIQKEHGKDYLENVVRDNPMTIFVYNKAQSDKGTETEKNDHYLDHMNVDNKLGLITMNDYSGKPLSMFYDSVDDSGKAIINQEVKENFDKALERLNDLRSKGYDIAFVNSGYAQYMIGADAVDNHLNSSLPKTAPLTFDYISKKLYINYKVINGAFDRYYKVNPKTETRTLIGKNFIQNYQMVDDNTVRSLIKNC